MYNNYELLHMYKGIYDSVSSDGVIKHQLRCGRIITKECGRNHNGSL